MSISRAFTPAESRKIFESAMHTKLMKDLNAKYVNVINESHMHNVPPDSRTHFKVIVVADKFNGLPLIKVTVQ